MTEKELMEMLKSSIKEATSKYSSLEDMVNDLVKDLQPNTSNEELSREESQDCGECDSEVIDLDALCIETKMSIVVNKYLDAVITGERDISNANELNTLVHAVSEALKLDI